MSVNKKRNIPAHGPYWKYPACRQLREAKSSLGMSLATIAELISANRHAVWKWVHGYRRPILSMRVKLRDQFGILEADWLSPTERSFRENIVKDGSKNSAKKASAFARKQAMRELGMAKQ